MKMVNLTVSWEGCPPPVDHWTYVAAWFGNHWEVLSIELDSDGDWRWIDANSVFIEDRDPPERWLPLYDLMQDEAEIPTS